MWAETARSGTAPRATGTGALHSGQTGTYKDKLVRKINR